MSESGFPGPAWLPPAADGGRVLDIRPAVPSLNVPRARPCQAKGIGTGAVECGATPASKWRRECPNGHARDCWLCGVHAGQAATGATACSDCIAAGAGNVVCSLVPVDLILLGHQGQGGEGR